MIARLNLADVLHMPERATFQVIGRAAQRRWPESGRQRLAPRCVPRRLRESGRLPREACSMNASLLAFDTSTEVIAIAVQSGSAVHSFEGPGGALASTRLIPEIHALLGRAGLVLGQLQAIAFGAGPGAFTGLRTACSVAQGLAFGAGLPVLPLDSLLLVAEAARDAATQPQGADGHVEVHVAMDARMGEVYAAEYRWTGARWHCLSAPALYTLAALNERWRARPPHIVAGSASVAFAGQLQLGQAHVVSAELPRAAALMRLAQGLWRDAGSIAAQEALPVYLRDKVALTTAERLAAARTGAGA
jgi:tRNA threonylcarbamoyladenosine biosynthesis protein TsaB